MQSAVHSTNHVSNELSVRPAKLPFKKKLTYEVSEGTCDLGVFDNQLTVFTKVFHLNQLSPAATASGKMRLNLPILTMKLCCPMFPLQSVYAPDILPTTRFPLGGNILRGQTD